MRLPRPIIFAVLLLSSSQFIWAQQISPSTPPPPPAEETPAPPAEPVFDPLHAEKSIEIGMFYLRKGNSEAALDRFMDATRFQPGLARPWRLIGETYEKMHDNGRAVESYKKYLQILPGAQDAAKVKKRIAALDAKTGQQASKRSPRLV